MEVFQETGGGWSQHNTSDYLIFDGGMAFVLSNFELLYQPMDSA